MVQEAEPTYPLHSALPDLHVSSHLAMYVKFVLLTIGYSCSGIEITSGFDSQMINAAQFVEEWQDCKCLLVPCCGGCMLIEDRLRGPW
jgi:hypothetical protein